ncbi:MAG: FHA domain-containing protein [Deltaproteobacteria bacterium]|nr:FHA domain-containing protein [Deltaproteobacteria bacterium]
MRQLTHIRDGQKIAEYLLDMQDVIIGRGHAAHIQLDGNPVVSRQHALVRAEGNGHVVEDLGGANGTFVDGRKVKRHVLRAGQRIVLGTDTLRYDFGHRGAQSLRAATGAAPSPSSEINTTDSIMEIGVTDVESFNTFEQLGDLGQLNRSKGVPAELGAERTTVADKNELEVLLARMNIKAKPHLQKLGPDDNEDDPDAGDLLPLVKSPLYIGHTDACKVRLPGKRWLIPGKIAGVLTVEAGRWHISPESTFWNPIWLGEDKLQKIRMLEAGDVFDVGGIRFVYRRGV